jgi:Chaperone of endosialidase
VHNFGSSNTFVGGSAGNFTMTGDHNTGNGASALHFNTSGIDNTAIGATALFNNTTGVENTALGSSALINNTIGYDNTAAGKDALFSNTIGTYNSAFGYSALNSNTSGNQNTAYGDSALYANATGSDNTAIGESALDHNTTGSNNTAIGYLAGTNQTSGGNNIYIASHGFAGESDTIRIGSSGVQGRAFVVGVRGVTTGNSNAIPVVIDSAGQLGTVSSSRRVKDDIVDMDAASSELMNLRPVTFHYKSDHDPAGRTLQYGLVAEEVAAIDPGLVAHSADGSIETVMYQFLPPMLLNEYQKQQRTIDAQALEIKSQRARIDALELQALEIALLKQQMAQIAQFREAGTRLAARDVRADTK